MSYTGVEGCLSGGRRVPHEVLQIFVEHSLRLNDIAFGTCCQTAFPKRRLISVLSVLREGLQGLRDDTLERGGMNEYRQGYAAHLCSILAVRSSSRARMIKLWASSALLPTCQ